MKHIRLLAAAVVLFCFCGSAGAQVVKTKTKVEGDEMKYKNKGFLYTLQEQSKIYQPAYSAQFLPGNQAYATQVLNTWKSYEANLMDLAPDFLADTLMATMPDGTVLKGKRAFVTAIKAYRSGFSSMKTTVEAWMPVKSIDQNKETVCIWGIEEGTKTDGTKSKLAVHELWFFNSDGKVDYFRQFTQQLPNN